MPKITNEITGLQGNLGRDVGVESLTYWGLSKVILKKEDTRGTWESNSIIVIVVKSIAGYCGRQEEPAILISRLQVDITHASHVCSQHLFGLPLRMNGMYRTQFDHARLDLIYNW